MSEKHNIRSNFVFAPPEDNESAWRSSLDTFEEALARAFPGAIAETQTSALRGDSVLDFDVEITPDVWVSGTAAMPSPDYASISLIDVTANEAAVFAQWLRDTYLPSRKCVRFLSSFVMENGDETPWQLPSSGDAEALAETMRRHIATVQAE
ncbi:hypothetical protein [Streptomyces sp. MK37H]|uniref:hypothetical protein n=1 Tax=Streptomyces sp. MK37H TaxID=2699117 RepID=UPI001B3976D8|nr:hypothetical protein [Streptomyces sp. MK37H]MBP8532148.1 hypothetical protein [Streptomyces sp. MK37H]